MNTLAGKKIILGITGSIAAYKAAFFVRLLVKKGADVAISYQRGKNREEHNKCIDKANKEVSIITSHSQSSFIILS